MNQVVTRLGTRALARALSEGAQVEFTRCAVGSGELPGGADPREREALVAPVAHAGITVVRKEADGVAVVSDFDNTVIPGGTAIRELGLFATAGGGEFLFAYAHSSDPEVVPPPEEATYERRFVSHIAMSDDEVEIVVTYERIAEAVEEALGDVLPEYVRWQAAGAAGGVAQLGADGKVPYAQLPDTCGREFATAQEVYAHFGYIVDPDDEVPDSEVADDGDVRAALAGETFEGGLSVPDSMIASDDEIRRYLNI